MRHPAPQNRGQRRLRRGRQPAVACPAALSALRRRAGPNAAVAAEVCRHLQGLRQPLAQLASGEVEGGWEGVQEVADAVLHAARLVWPLRGQAGWAFSQRRLQHWLQVVGAALCQHVQVRP